MTWLEATSVARVQRRKGNSALMMAGLAGVLGVGVAVSVFLPQAAGLAGIFLLMSIASAGLFELVRQARKPRLPRAGTEADLARKAALAAMDDDLFFITGADGLVLYASAAYRRLVGGGSHGTAALERRLPEGAEGAEALYRLARAARAGEARTEIVTLHQADGPAIPWRITVTPAPTPNQGFPGASLWRLAPPDLPAPLPASAESAPAPVPAWTSAGGPFHEPARIIEEAPVGILLVDRTGCIVDANRAFRALLPAGEDASSNFADLLLPEDRDELLRRMGESAADAQRLPFEIHLKGKPERVGQLFMTRLDHAPSGPDESPLWLFYFLDTTEQKTLEIQFAQSQKMQAVGQLAGGIAHDFNNVLTAILGFCDLLLTRHGAGDPSFGDIMQIHQNAQRAAGLVRQLLAFSRQQTLRPKVLWLPDAIDENKTLLTRLVGERVRLDIKHDRDVGLVKVDDVQLVQVLMNLAANARDAMPDGGTLSIRTRNISRAESVRLGHDLMPPGDYVLLEVGDTGTGIPPEILGKIFEPFFTTKEVGQGTGLGLSTVYGIVKQTAGFIFPESELGRGTTFRIYLPRHVEAAPAMEAKAALQTRAEDHTGRGTILLVEDEDAVRSFASRALSSRGYTVLEAVSGEAALEIIKTRGKDIDLLISDVVMPAMDGPTLVREVKLLAPQLRVILISGYAEDAFRKALGRDPDLAFLPKPFSLKQLISKVKEVMAAG